jgi:endoglucanase
MGSELSNALAAVRWGSDYVLKTFKAPSLQYAQVGDGNTDHAW